MLANVVADNFDDITNIDWANVAANEEFAGHTEGSLRNQYFSKLLRNAKRNLKKENADLFPKDVALVAEKLSARSKGIAISKVTRQNEVIKYFEDVIVENKERFQVS